MTILVKPSAEQRFWRIPTGGCRRNEVQWLRAVREIKSHLPIIYRERRVFYGSIRTMEEKPELGVGKRQVSEPEGENEERKSEGIMSWSQGELLAANITHIYVYVWTMTCE